MVEAQKKNFISGMIKAFPLVIGYLPIAISFGVISLNAGIPLLQTVLMSLLVYAGASQFMAINMFTVGAGALEIVMATFVLNLRHFIMSLSLMNLWDHLPKRWKSIFAFGITDETFAIASLKTEEDAAASSKAYLIGLLVTAYGSWVSGTLIGGLLAGVIPPTISESMSIGLYGMFIGLLVPAVQRLWKTGIVAVVSMGLCTLFNQFFASGWSIILAAVIGATLGAAILKEEEAR